MENQFDKGFGNDYNEQEKYKKFLMMVSETFHPEPQVDDMFIYHDLETATNKGIETLEKLKRKDNDRWYNVYIIEINGDSVKTVREIILRERGKIETVDINV